MITFEKELKTFFLDGKNTTYAFRINKVNHLEHLYFGSKIGHDDLSYIWKKAYLCGHDALREGGVFEMHVGQEAPSFGTGDYREPMILVTDKKGDFIPEFEYVGYEVQKEPSIPGMPSTFGGETLIVTLFDNVKNLELKLYYTLFEDTDAITRFASLQNKGNDSVDINRFYSFSLDFQDQNYDVLSLYGAWANERNVQKTPVHYGVWSIDSKRVNSSASLNPFIALMDKDATEHLGDVYGFNLVYSSSYRLFVEGASNGRLRVGGGISEFNFNWILKEQETFFTPEVVMAYSNEGLNGMSHIFHDTYRNHLISKKHVFEHRPIVINNWEATTFNFDNQKLMNIVDAVEGTGIDMLVLDDGWFGARNNDKAGLGDWVVNTDKLEGGLNTIINHCHKKGLKFGLWFEPEMVNPDSDLYRLHPDWAVHCPGHAPTESRNQYILDLTRKEVCDYIVTSVNKILDTHEIDYVKWDFNRNAVEDYSVGLSYDEQREFAHRYALGLYDICERIINTHKEIFFEGCSSGGARFDPAMLYYFPQIWTSDNSDAPQRTRIQWGTSYAYPLSSMSCHVSFSPNHQTKHVTPIQTRAHIAHLGATGYELDASTMDPKELQDIPREVEEYHQMEGLMLGGDFYRLVSPFDNQLFACELVSKDQKNAHLTLMRLLSLCNPGPILIKLKGLNPNFKYQIKETGEVYSGSTLMQVGFPTSYDYLLQFHSAVWTLEKV